MKYILTLFALLIIFNTGCKSDTSHNPADSKTNKSSVVKNKRDLPAWASNANIYEVNIRQYTPEGTFNAFAKNLPRLKKMGVDILWFMPIFPISDTKKKGTLGSYYAVSDFEKQILSLVPRTIFKT